jgi:hypothetical protein
VEQIMALYDTSAGCPAGSSLDRRIVRLRWWAVWFLNYLADSPAQAILIGEQLLTDQEQVLGPDHPDTLQSRNNLANACQAADRTNEARDLNLQPSDSNPGLRADRRRRSVIARSDRAGCVGCGGE